MYTTYHLRADELNEETIRSLKNTYQEREIIILSKDDYDDELERIRFNTSFTEKLQQRMKALDEGKGVTKTITELEALANE